MEESLGGFVGSASDLATGLDVSGPFDSGSAKVSEEMHRTSVAYRCAGEPRSGELSNGLWTGVRTEREKSLCKLTAIRSNLTLLQ